MLVCIGSVLVCTSGACQVEFIGGCSLELCSATLSMASSGICCRNVQSHFNSTAVSRALPSR